MFRISTRRLTERQLKIAVLILPVIFVATATVASINRLRQPTTASNGSAEIQVRATQSANQLEAQRITLRPTGFEPAEVTRPAGRFLLAVNDRSGRSDLNLILMRNTGERLKEVRLRDTPRKHEWRELVNLPPGQYRLIDGANPELACRIVLTN